jgi:hypothetical protein
MENVKDIIAKLSNRELMKDDLGNFLNSLTWYVNQSGFAEDEIYGWNKQVQFIMEDSEDFFFSVKEPFSDHPVLTVNFGNVKSPHTTIKTDSNILMGLLCRRIRYGSLNPKSYIVEGDYFNYQLILILMGMMIQEMK